MKKYATAIALKGLDATHVHGVFKVTEVQIGTDVG
jgi:hypothetical protein